ncbi:MAG: NDUFA4 family protein [Bdellovibrionales bacterium]|nr:NDUFA4 family protein [Bdellovibrionales bacterium]
MLKIFISLLLLSVSSSGFAQGESVSPERKMALIHFGPLGVAVGFAGFGAEFSVTDHLLLGPDFRGVSYKRGSSEAEHSGVGYGLRATWQFGEPNGISTGWLTSASFVHFSNNKLTRWQNLDILSGPFTGTQSYTYTNLSGGYRWVWNRFTLKLVGGIEVYGRGDVEMKNSSGAGYADKYDSSRNLFGDVNIGVVF